MSRKPSLLLAPSLAWPTLLGGTGGDRSGLRRALAALLALIPLLALLAWAQQPENLEEITLVGPRPPSAVRLVVLLDESGSFADYAPLRKQVVDKVVAWAPDNLRHDDSLAVVGFSDTAYVKLPQRPVGQLSTVRAVTHRAPGDGTLIQPAVRVAIRELRRAGPGGGGGDRGPSVPTSLIVVTDTIVSDADRAAIDAVAAPASVMSVSVIHPRDVEVSAEWEEAFPYQAVWEADPDDPAATALAVGYAIAHATGQQVETT